MRIKVVHINVSNAKGGSARAASRIHEALLAHDVDSYLWVNHMQNSFAKNTFCLTNTWSFVCLKIKNKISSFLCKLTSSFQYHHLSLSLFPSSLLDRINNSDADLVHLHWVQNEMISIEQIGQIKKPVVWTFHDMWPFCGGEHLTDTDRWSLNTEKIPMKLPAIDICFWVWKRKYLSWKNQQFYVTCPSQRHADLARKSYLFSNHYIKTIYNPLDHYFWRPISTRDFRYKYLLKQDFFTLVFSSYGDLFSYTKGFDLLKDALNDSTLLSVRHRLRLILLGDFKDGSRLEDLRKIVTIVPLGCVDDDTMLREVFNAADCLIVTSRHESFCQLASEAQACGLPVIAFAIGGLIDIIIDNVTGFLVAPFDTHLLANAIKSFSEFPHYKINSLRESSRNLAMKRFSYRSIAASFVNVYHKALLR